MDDKLYDVAIVGGGPAGLSAALLLGRCQRSVILFDTLSPRNDRSQALHAFLTRDGIAPAEFYRLAREDLKKYPVIKSLPLQVVSVQKEENYFCVKTAESFFRARRVLLATGVKDIIPDLPGLAELFGKAVFHCPYCDGWERTGATVGVFGDGRAAYKMALTLLCWTSELTIFSNASDNFSDEMRSGLGKLGIKIHTGKVKAFASTPNQRALISFEDQPSVTCDALFLATGTQARAHLAEGVGCKFDEKGTLETDDHTCTSIAGVFAAGDLLREAQFSMVAAAQGMEAALRINISLLQESINAAGVDWHLD